MFSCLDTAQLLGGIRDGDDTRRKDEDYFPKTHGGWMELIFLTLIDTTHATDQFFFISIWIFDLRAAPRAMHWGRAVLLLAARETERGTQMLLTPVCLMDHGFDVFGWGAKSDTFQSRDTRD